MTFPPVATRRLALIACLIGVQLLILAWTSATPAHAAGLSNPDALTVHEGSITVKDDGTVIENLEIRGTLRIEAKNVIVRNVWVYTSAPWTIYVASGSATFDNIEVGHPSIWGLRGIGGANVVVRNADIHHVEDGIKLGSNATYSGVRVHDLASPEPGPHADAVQVEGTAKNSVIKNSWLSSKGNVGLGNAAIFVKSDLGAQSNLTFSNNYLNGGNYTVYVKNGGYGNPQNVAFVDNRIGPDRRYGLVSQHGPIIWENNTWADTGEVIDVKGNVIAPGSGPAPTTTTTAPAQTTTTIAATTTTTSAPAQTTTTTKAATTTTKAPTTTTDAASTTTTIAPVTTTTEAATTSTTIALVTSTTEAATTTTTPSVLVLIEPPTDDGASEASIVASGLTDPQGSSEASVALMLVFVAMAISSALAGVSIYEARHEG